jgi:hypothetical protein
MLPSGVIFAYSPPAVEELVARGLMPEELRKVAMQFAASAVNPETMDTGALSELMRFLRVLIAQSLHYIWIGNPEPIEEWATYDAAKSWQSVTITAADLEESSVDQDDYAALTLLVSRETTAQQLTAQSLAEHGLIGREEADRRIAESKAAAVPGWSSFRSERRGADPGSTGAAVARSPVRAGGRKRSGDRARAR